MTTPPTTESLELQAVLRRRCRVVTGLVLSANFCPTCCTTTWHTPDESCISCNPEGFAELIASRVSRGNSPTIPRKTPRPTHNASKDRAEAVYAAYPRKVGRVSALKAIHKAAESLRLDGDKTPYEYLLEAATAYAASPAGMRPSMNGEDFRPHPATWFNSGRYLDDRAEWAKPNGSCSNIAAKHQAVNESSVRVADSQMRERQRQRDEADRARREQDEALNALTEADLASLKSRALAAITKPLPSMVEADPQTSQLLRGVMYAHLKRERTEAA